MIFSFAAFDSTSGGMALAKGLSRFHEKALSFKIFLAQLLSLKPDGMVFAKYPPPFCKKVFPFHVGFTKRAVEALGVVVVVESLHPPISGLYGEPAVYALGGEQLVPVIFTVRQAILQVEGRVSEDFPAVSTSKTFRVESLTHRLQTVLSLHP